VKHSTLDQMVLTLTLFGEARGESFLGKKMIAHVIVNRAIKKGKPIAQMCLQAKQFSCWNGLQTIRSDDDDVNLTKLLYATGDEPGYAECVRAAEEVLTSAGILDPTFGSTHYHTLGVYPYWAKGHTPATTCGAHVFYNDIAF